MTSSRRRTIRWAFITLGLIALVVSGAVYRNGERIDYSIRSFLRLERHKIGTNPVGREVAAGRFQAGDSLEDLIAAYPPWGIIRGQRYAIVDYRPSAAGDDGVIVIAKDGRLAWAILGNSSETLVSAFNTLSPTDVAALYADIAAAKDRRQVRMAVAGFAATIDP